MAPVFQIGERTYSTSIPRFVPNKAGNGSPDGHVMTEALIDAVRQAISGVIRLMGCPSNLSPQQALAWADAHAPEAEARLVRLRLRLGFPARYQAWFIGIWRHLVTRPSLQPVYDALEELRVEFGYEVSRRKELSDQFSISDETGVRDTERGKELARRVREIVKAHGLPMATSRSLTRLFYFGEVWCDNELVFAPYATDTDEDGAKAESRVRGCYMDLGCEPRLEIAVHLAARREDAADDEDDTVGFVMGSLALASRLKAAGLGDHNPAARVLRCRGDFVIHGNLETIRAADLRSVGSWLVKLKAAQRAGRLARTGRGHRSGKKVLAGRSWKEVTAEILEHPERAPVLLERYVEQRIRDIEEDYRTHGGRLSDVARSEEVKLAQKEFGDRILYWKKRLAPTKLN